jgi:thermitase
MKLAILLLLLPTITSNAANHCKPFTVGVVDTGLDLNDPRLKDHLCPIGHKDFTGEGIKDINGHGTHVTGLIEQYAKNGNYCIQVYKYFQESVKGQVNLDRELLALHEAIKNGVDIVNFSGGGPQLNEEESLIIKNHPEVTFVVAAGNDGRDLDDPFYEYYPAQLFYKNMIVVGGLDVMGNKVPSSNYSRRIKTKELGENVRSTYPDGQFAYLSGTSQATAIATGKLVDNLSKSCKYR